MAWGMNENPPNGDSEYRYESYTGNLYKYDLSKPADRNLYSTDFAAQNRDRISIQRKMDEDRGYYGGGIMY